MHFYTSHDLLLHILLVKNFFFQYFCSLIIDADALLLVGLNMDCIMGYTRCDIHIVIEKPLSVCLFHSVSLSLRVCVSLSLSVCLSLSLCLSLFLSHSVPLTPSFSPSTSLSVCVLLPLDLCLCLSYFVLRYCIVLSITLLFSSLLYRTLLYIITFRFNLIILSYSTINNIV